MLLRCEGTLIGKATLPVLYLSPCSVWGQLVKKRIRTLCNKVMKVIRLSENDGYSHTP